MRRREHAQPPRPHQEFFPLETHPSDQTRKSGSRVGVKHGTVNGHAPQKLWVNIVDGMVSSTAPASSRAVRGGMLCDEPGLGKTITVLALLLRTRGLLPGGFLACHAVFICWRRYGRWGT